MNKFGNEVINWKIQNLISAADIIQTSGFVCGEIELHCERDILPLIQ